MKVFSIVFLAVGVVLLAIAHRLNAKGGSHGHGLAGGRRHA